MPERIACLGKTFGKHSLNEFLANVILNLDFFSEKNSVITTDDVKAGINDRNEFENILQSYSNKSDMEYYM